MSNIEVNAKPVKKQTITKINSNKVSGSNGKKEEIKKSDANKKAGRSSNRELLEKDQNNKRIHEIFKKMENPVKQSTDEKVKEKTEGEWEGILNLMKSEILEVIKSEIGSSLKEMERKVECKMEELISKTEEKIIESQNAIEHKIFEQCKSVELKLNKWDEEKKELLGRIDKLEEFERKRDQEYRRKNIIIRGLRTEKNDIRTEVEDFIQANLNLKVNLETATKIKPTKGEEFLKFRVRSIQDKRMILEKKTALKGTQIYFDEDLTKEDREIQKKIYIKAKEERNRGNIAKIGYKKIYINNQLWIWRKDEGLVRQSRSFRQGDNHSEDNRFYFQSRAQIDGRGNSSNGSNFTLERGYHNGQGRNEVDNEIYSEM